MEEVRAEVLVPEHLGVLGAEVPRLGKRITIGLLSAHDLNRLVLRSNTTSVVIPEIDLVMPPSQGSFTSVRDQLHHVCAQLRQSSTEVPPHKGGPTEDDLCRFRLERLGQVLSGELRCSFVLDDPLGLARAEREDHEGDDAGIDAGFRGVTVERYERTWEQRVDHGLNDAWKPGRQYVGRELGLARLVQLISDSHNIVFLTGAGVSTGIPAFRDSAGVVGGLSIWDRYNRKPAHFQDFVAEKAARVEYWRMHVDLHAMTSRAAPNASHHIAVLLAAQGRLLGVVTQNIDGLYHRAGLDPAKLVELHGTSARARCLQCSALYPMGAIVLDIEAGEAVVPHCQAEGCGGVLKPDTVSFGQRLRHANIVRTRQWLNACDLLIVMGTSLRVEPVNKYPTISLNKRTPMVLVNMDETMYDDYAEVLLNDGLCGEMMAAVQHALQQSADT